MWKNSNSVQVVILAIFHALHYSTPLNQHPNTEHTNTTDYGISCTPKASRKLLHIDHQSPQTQPLSIHHIYLCTNIYYSVLRTLYGIPSDVISNPNGDCQRSMDKCSIKLSIGKGCFYFGNTLRLMTCVASDLIASYLPMPPTEYSVNTYVVLPLSTKKGLRNRTAKTIQKAR